MCEKWENLATYNLSPTIFNGTHKLLRTEKKRLFEAQEWRVDLNGFLQEVEHGLEKGGSLREAVDSGFGANLTVGESTSGHDGGRGWNNNGEGWRSWTWIDLHTFLAS